MGAVTDKGKEQEMWEEIALSTKKVCDRYGATLIINDNPELAAKVGAYGVHLGKSDMSPVQAREIVGDKMIIGGTANSFEDIEDLVRANVDYVGLGPYRFTPTKEKLRPILGMEGYAKIISRCQLADIHVPIIAIGGVRLEDVQLLLRLNAYGLAVSSAISDALDRVQASAAFVDALYT